MFSNFRLLGVDGSDFCPSDFADLLDSGRSFVLKFDFLVGGVGESIIDVTKVDWALMN